ncbi:MAG: PTS sugar transporter subunit IIC [Traorella sp.]
METFIAWLEKNLMPIANKLAKQRHLMAIRDTFMTILPPIFFGGIIAVINSAPAVEGTTNAFMLAWANFASQNATILSWLNTVSLGFLSFYVCIGVTYYLCKHYEITPFMPIVISIVGFMMLTAEPAELSYGNVLGQLTYFDGKGMLVALFISIATVEAYRFLTSHHVGEIKMPDSVPPALSQSFGSLATCLIILVVDSLIFTVCYKTQGVGFAHLVLNVLSPAIEATDNIGTAILVAVLLNVGWFFGIHDAVWGGFLSPIEYGTLSMNAAAKAAGTALPAVFTVSFWCYFGIIGGLGNCLALGILCLLSKRKDINTVGKLGIVPAFFGISEPITFGLPIMLNPILFIPCVLTSVVNVVASYLLMANGIIGRTFAMLSYNMPSVFGAYFSTGDFKAAILIIVLVIVDMIIYYPFFKAHERATEELAED